MYSFKVSDWIIECCTICNLPFIADVIDEAKDEVQKLGLDPYDDFKDITENVESDLIKCILDHEEFLETVRFFHKFSKITLFELSIF